MLFLRRHRFKIIGALITAFVLFNALFYQQSMLLTHQGFTTRHVKNNNTNRKIHSINNKSPQKINNSADINNSHHQMINHNKNHTAIVTTFNFQYVRNPEHVCSNSSINIEIVICVPISRHNFEGRRTISDTWGSYAYEQKNEAVLLFFIGNGSKSESPEIEARIHNESILYNDIVQVDYIDSYRNLSLKSISILKWVSIYCPQTKFVLKADDDMYVNIPSLVKFLRDMKTKSKNSPFITGHFITGAVPIRTNHSKWYTNPSEFAGKVFPDYFSGTSYAMTGEAAKLLYRVVPEVSLFWLEDIYITGLCRVKAGISMKKNAFMTFNKPKPTGCVFRQMISGHRYTLAQMSHIHKELYDTTLKC